MKTPVMAAVRALILFAVTGTANADWAAYSDYEEQFAQERFQEYVSLTADLGRNVGETLILVEVSLSNHFFWSDAGAARENREWYYELRVNGESGGASQNHEIPAAPAVLEGSPGDKGAYVRRGYHTLRFLVRPGQLVPGENTFTFRGIQLPGGADQGEFYTLRVEGILMTLRMLEDMMEHPRVIHPKKN